MFSLVSSKFLAMRNIVLYSVACFFLLSPDSVELSLRKIYRDAGVGEGGVGGSVNPILTGGGQIFPAISLSTAPPHRFLNDAASLIYVVAVLCFVCMYCRNNVLDIFIK